MTRRALMATLAGAAVAPMLPVKLTKDEWLRSVIPPITPADMSIRFITKYDPDEHFSLRDAFLLMPPITINDE